MRTNVEVETRVEAPEYARQSIYDEIDDSLASNIWFKLVDEPLYRETIQSIHNEIILKLYESKVMNGFKHEGN